MSGRTCITHAWNFDLSSSLSLGWIVPLGTLLLSLLLLLNLLLSIFNLDGVMSAVIWNSTRRTDAVLILLIVIVAI